jgi:hypothetical protein
VDTIIESDVKEFISRLPDLTANMAHLIMLNVRSRKVRALYPEFKANDLVVERKIIRPYFLTVDDEEQLATISETSKRWRERYLNSVYNFSLLQCGGKYEVKNRLIPAEGLVIYGTLSPRDVRKATLKLMQDDLKLLYDFNTETTLQLGKQASMFFGYLHSSKVKGLNFQTIDIDSDDTELTNKILADVSGLPIWMITKTSRGHHVILDLCNPEDAKRWFAPGKNGEPSVAKTIADKYGRLGVELQHDSQEPIPGTLHFIDGSKELNYVRIVK